MQLRNILFAGALLVMAPASAALAEECTFVPGDTVLQERGASDQRITQFLSDLGASRSGQTINTRIFSEQVALTMVQGNLAERVSAACRNQLAAGFTSVNGLQGKMTDAQFATKVRSTGFRLPTMVAVAQAPAPPPAAVAASLPQAAPLPIAQPAPPPVQVARLSPADRATLESLTTERAQLRGQISELRGRPFITSNDRQLLDSLQGNLDAINDRIEALTTLNNGLRRDVDRLRGDVVGQGHRLTALEQTTTAHNNQLGRDSFLLWVVGILASLGAGLGFWNFFKKASRKDVNQRISIVTDHVDNVAHQSGFEDFVSFSSTDVKYLKELQVDQEVEVMVLVNGQPYTSLKFRRGEQGHFQCIEPMTSRPIANPLMFARQEYAGGHLRD